MRRKETLERIKEYIYLRPTVQNKTTKKKLEREQEWDGKPLNIVIL